MRSVYKNTLYLMDFVVNGKPATQRLKEYADRARVTIVYTCSKEGPDHCPTFLARVTVKDRANSTVAQSHGRDGSKKVARNIAAMKVLGLLPRLQPRKYAVC